MARKKILFVIVEGPSDQQALSALISRIFSDASVYVHIVHGDITSQLGVTPANVLKRLGDVINHYLRSNHFHKSDLLRIVHITDTDGAFIPDEAVVCDSRAAHALYSEDCIRTRDEDSIRKRNARKSANLRKLYGISELAGAPYSIFYMSCNLDHVLYDKQNSSDREKEDDSYRFAIRYRNDLPSFISFMEDSPFAVTVSYPDSWDYIEQDLNSLQRHSNLCLLFE